MTVRTSDHQELTDALMKLAKRTRSWLRRRLHDCAAFELSAHAFDAPSLNATTGGIELWLMLDMPLSEELKAGFIRRLQSFQNVQSGLVVDPSWSARQILPSETQTSEGDSFFTMTAAAALHALRANFEHPVAAIAACSAEALMAQTTLQRGAHQLWSIGDYGRLVEVNRRLDDTLAEGQRGAILEFLSEHQKTDTGLWIGETQYPSALKVNHGFHMLRSSYNLFGAEIPRADRIIDSGLFAAGDEQFYGGSRGYACNDLDLAHVLYSARCWSSHRAGEVAALAGNELTRLLALEDSQGGFAFNYRRAMTHHGGLAMGPGLDEADTWGTLMYLGAIRMWAALCYPAIDAPWHFSEVHAVPKVGLK